MKTKPVAWARVMCVASVALAAQAQAHSLLRPAGVPFDVVTGRDAVPSVTLDGVGRATIAWIEPGDVARLWAQSYDTQFRRRGRAWLVREGDAAISGARVTATRLGRVLVSWSEGADAEARSFYRLFDADGTLVEEDLVSAEQPTETVFSAADGAGRFVLAWKESDGVYAQLLDAAGAVRAKRFRVAAGTRGALEPRALAAESGGAFVVFWRDDTAAEARFYGLRFDAAGTAQGVPFELAGVDTAAAVPGGGVVAWTDTSAGQTHVRLRRLSPAGAPLGAVVQVDSGAWADAPRLAADGAGNVVVAFRGASGAGSDVFARRFTATGVADGPPFALAGAAWDANAGVELASSPRGDVLAVWRHVVPRTLALQARAFRVPPKGDFDGDLRADLVLRRERDGAARVWTMGEGRRASNLRVWRTVPGPDWTLVSADDFTGDGRQDLVFQNESTGEVSFVALAGPWGTEVAGTFALEPAAPAGATLAATGDFDGDGWPDLVWRDTTTHALTLWAMQGTRRTGTRAFSPRGLPDASWQVLGAHDWDGDGLRDLLLYDGDAGRIVQWRLDADLVRTGERLIEPTAPADPAWSVVAAGDYGVGPGGVAGTADVVWRSARTNRQVIWFLDTEGRRTAGVFTTPTRPSGATRLDGPR